MKRYISALLVIILAAVLVLSVTSCGKDKDVPAGMIKASGDEADFTLYVPEKWTVDMATAAVSAYAGKDDPSSVSVMGWDLEYTDYSLDEWWEVNESENAKVFGDYETVSEEDLTVDGLYAEKKIYTASLGDYEYRIMQVACVKKATVYLFTYTSTPDTFDSHLDEVGQMLANLKIGR